MYHNFKAIECFLPWHVVKKYMPDIFKQNYPNMRIIIDATEFVPLSNPHHFYYSLVHFQIRTL